MDDVSRIGRSEFIAGPTQTTILPKQKRGSGTRAHTPKPEKDGLDMPAGATEERAEPGRLDLRM
jgi:hypothetical protein